MDETVQIPCIADLFRKRRWATIAITLDMLLPEDDDRANDELVGIEQMINRAFWHNQEYKHLWYEIEIELGDESG